MIYYSVKDWVNWPEGGFSMKRFLSDAHRRNVWVEKCSRANWMPSFNSCKCEVSYYL